MKNINGIGKRYLRAAVALILVALMAIGLAACGSKDGGSNSGSSEPANSAGKSMEEILIAAAKNMEEAESMTYTMNMEIAMSVFGMDMDTVMDADIQTIQEPTAMAITGKMDMGALGSYDMDIYAETEGDELVMYTGAKYDDEVEWIKTRTDMNSSEISQYNAQSNIKTYMENADSFEQVGEEEVNGVKTVRFDGVIKGDSIGKVLKESGMDEQIGGIDSDDLSELYSQVKDMPVSFWVDTENELISQFSIDMGETLKNMVELSMEQAAEEEPIDDEDESFDLAGMFSIEGAKITMTITGINNVDSIEVPAEAKEKASEIEI